MSVTARQFASVTALVLFALGFSAPVAAQTQQELNWCTDENGATSDLIISGCTAVIQSGTYTGKDLAFAFNNRGIAYVAKGQYDRAIQDYDQAIRLNPSNAKAFYNRGFAYHSKKQYDRAIQDYDQAIRVDPKIRHRLQ